MVLNELEMIQMGVVVARFKMRLIISLNYGLKRNVIGQTGSPVQIRN